MSPREPGLVEREEFKNLRAEVTKLSSKRGEMGDKADETSMEVREQRRMHEYIRRIMMPNQERVAQSEENVGRKLVNIESGLSHATTNMRAGFAAVEKEEDGKIKTTKDAMAAAHKQITQTMRRHKEKANDAIRDVHDVLKAEMCRNRAPTDGASAETLPLLLSEQETLRPADTTESMKSLDPGPGTSEVYGTSE